MKKFLMGLLLLTAALSAAYASGGQEGGGEKADARDTLKVVLFEEPAVLNMQSKTPTEPTCIIANNLYDPLVILDPETQEIKPNVATSWEWLDNTHIQFTIRDDVQAADGTFIDANDVYYSFEEGIKGTNFGFGRIFNIDECKVVDKYTVILGLNSPYPTLLDVMCGVTYNVIDKSSVEAVGGLEASTRDPKIGTGKYNFVKWVDGQYILLERNENYWNKDAMPSIKYIQYTFVNDTAARAMAVESGDVDIATRMGIANVKGIEDSESARMMIEPTNASKCFWMNCSNEYLSDKRVREAIFWLLDVEQINQLMTGGYGLITDTQISPASLYYAPPKKQIDRKVDVARAKKLLAEAGYPDGFEINIDNVLAQDIPLAELIQANFQAAGIKANISMVESMTGITNMNNGTYDVFTGSAYGWDMARLLLKVDGRVPTNKAGGGAQYNDDELNKYIDAALSELDFEKRKAAYGKVQEFVRDDFIVIGLYNNVSMLGVSNIVDNVLLDVSGYLDCSNAVFK